MTDAAVVLASASVVGSLLSTQHWVFDVLSQLLLPSLWTLAAAPVALIALMLVPSVSIRHIIAVPIALVALAAGAPLVDDPDTAVPEGATRLTVYQHNIYVENIVFDRIVETVEREDPDIIALVEARDDTLAPWEARLAERWPYGARARTPAQSYARLRLFSKYRIIDFKVRKRDYEPATLLARLETPGGEVTVLLTHFTRPWPFRSPDAQMLHYRSLESILQDVSGPLVLLGDFNSAPWGRIGRRLQENQGFQLANRRAAGTWPGRVNIDDMMNTLGLPRALTIPIDLAFCRAGAVCNNHRVGDNLGSDHRAVQFDVYLLADQ